MKRQIIFFLLIILNIICFSFCSVNLYLFLEVKNYKNLKKISYEVLGKQYLELNLNEEYLEQGAKFIYDEKDYNMNTSGLVDTSKIGTYLVVYDLPFKDLNVDKKYKIIKIKDEEAPIIKLKNSPKVSVYVGEKYEEPGVTVTDNSKEDLSSKVEVEGKVDNKKVGIYKIKYKVSDSSGNTSEITREIEVKNRPVVTRMAITKVANVEKGSDTKAKLDLNKDSNTVISMNFTKNGLYINGYVKDGNGTYVIRMCNKETCKDTKMKTKNTKYYFGDIDLSTLSNGTYNMKIKSKSELEVINKLEDSERIVRAKVGDKLVTIDYSKNKQTVKIENFAYSYDILIDVGHGGTDSGAVNSKIKEKNLNLEQSLYEKKRYEAHGLKVKLTRTDDTYGLVMGNSRWPRVRRRANAIGYYGVVSKYIYSNHHNSTTNDYISGWEIIVPTKATKNEYAEALKIANIWREKYPTGEDHTRIYSRNYDNGNILNKSSAKVYNSRNWYAVLRIPYELYNVNVTLYEGCYLSNKNDFDWYMKNWKAMSEAKIKTYVESLGKQYIPV